jgi:hypothetical protein
MVDELRTSGVTEDAACRLTDDAETRYARATDLGVSTHVGVSTPGGLW